MSSDECEVTRHDLERLDGLLALLGALSDPFASATRLTTLVEAIPVLAARLIRHARSRAPLKEVRTVARALAIVGNQGLEVVLLALLEDLTILKGDLDDAER